MNFWDGMLLGTCAAIAAMMAVACVREWLKHRRELREYEEERLEREISRLQDRIRALELKSKSK